MNPALANLTAIHAWKLPAFLRNPGSRQATTAQVVEQPFQHIVKGSTVTVRRMLGHGVDRS